jgi:hypothetical protein
VRREVDAGSHEGIEHVGGEHGVCGGEPSASWIIVKPASSATVASFSTASSRAGAQPPQGQ